MMKKRILISLALLLLLCACSDRNRLAVEFPTAGGENTPEPTASVSIGGMELTGETTEINLIGSEYKVDELVGASDSLKEVKKIDLGEIDMPYEQFKELKKAYPNAEISYSVSLFGEKMDLDTASLDLSNMTPDKSGELAAVLPYLEKLEEINFVNAEGACVYDLSSISELDKLKEAAPKVKFNVAFELFGQTLTSDDERIEYVLTPIGNEGAAQIRAILPYLTNCTYFLLDDCGIDNEVLDQMRSDFPDTKIVWRVWFFDPGYRNLFWERAASCLTDGYRLRTVYIDDANRHLASYCNEVKYMDVGHNFELTNVDFVRNMPNLEVVIITITNVNDLAPFASCKNLEYLELVGTQVRDVSPLAKLENLRHLNISETFIDDCTALYDLNLDRFKAVGTQVPRYQLEKFVELHPDCETYIDDFEGLGFGWRWTEFTNSGSMVPRYDLLRQQMEYDFDTSIGIP